MKNNVTADIRKDKMKLLYLFPRILDLTFQNTTENEIARAIKRQGHLVETIQAYQREKIQLDGFTDIMYVHVTSSGLFAKLIFQLKVLAFTWKSDADVILLGYSVAHLIPLLAMRSKIFKKAKCILDIRSVPVDLAPGIKGRVQEGRYRLGIWLADKFCDGITAITPMLRDTLIPHLKRLKNNVGIWTSGVNLEYFQAAKRDNRGELGLKDKKVLIYHGVLSPNRGLKDVITAVGLLREEYDDLHFLVVGEGPGKEEMEKEARRCGVESRVLFTGHVSYRDIPKYLGSADVGILPFPNIEWWAVSSPIKLMEYLAIGLPVIATDIAAIRYVTDQTGGAVLARDNRPENLAEAIRAFYEKGCPSVSRDLLEDTISWNKQAKSLLQYINDI